MVKNDFFKRYAVLIAIFLCTICLASCGMQEAGSDSGKGQEIGLKTYLVDIALSGGTGKAFIKSPVMITESDSGLTAKLVWSSKNYDYMIVDGTRYDNENPEGESIFTIAIDNITDPLTVIADTVAMSTPHEIEYVITWGEKEAAISYDDSDKSASLSRDKNEETSAEDDTDVGTEVIRDALVKETDSDSEKVPLQYATGFQIEKYGDYILLSIGNSGNYLIVPEGRTVPEGLPDDAVILKMPLDRTYLVSTSAMDLINACGALDMVKLSGTKVSDWYIDEARQAMENGSILYAGKYRAPDYELILESGCNLAIENTMIYHEPAVKEKLTELGIPVLVETSSYEEHPLGRLEWIKLYGILYDREAEAEKYFDEQLEDVTNIMQSIDNTGKMVAFFHVTANGLINVRKSGDYITRMIEMSGGSYVPSNAGESENALSTMNMQMEDFYVEAKEADIIIYNSTIGGEITSIDELTGKNELFKDFKAVREGNVYCTERNLFQQTTDMAEFMRDLCDVFSGVERKYTYLNKLD